SDGRVTVNKGEKLPTGTYFYIVSYEYKDASGSRMIKKSGYLHLESNK
ncbi:gliding motility-associated C-terminal domain-containing protein, partial [Myroides odoratimimus]|nr:gliding motility-associated C-terminal domain-containing protein [Myroides odoratimimus]